MNDITDFDIAHLHITLYGKKSDALIYILQPESVTEGVSFLTDEFPVTLVSVDGMDWNRDLSPWKAPGVFKGEEDFGGGADDFMKCLENDVFPKVESLLHGKEPAA